MSSDCKVKLPGLNVVPLWLCVFFFGVLISGCGSSATDGHLIDLPGQEMKLNFVVDEQQMIVYVVHATKKTPYPIASKTLEIAFTVDDKDLPVSLTADPQPDDPEGMASQFSIDFDQLPDALYGTADFMAEFTVDIDGQSVSGSLHHHDDHQHTHQHHD